MSNTYVSYMSNDRDLIGILVLSYNLKKINSKYPFCCIVMENVSTYAIMTLKAHGITIIKFDLKEYLLELGAEESLYKLINDKYVFGKFYIFNLIEYETVVYLDSDTLIMHNIDHLFDKPVINNMLYMVPDMQATSEYQSIIFIKNRYNSGVIVTKPNRLLYEKSYSVLLEQATHLFHTPKLFVSDQFIFEYMHDNKIIDIYLLDIKYNIHPILIESALSLNVIDKPYIVHFMIRPKPWEFLNLNIAQYKFENSICKDMFMMWIDLYLEYMKSIYLNSNTKTTNIQQYIWGQYSNNELTINTDNKL